MDSSMQLRYHEKDPTLTVKSDGRAFVELEGTGTAGAEIFLPPDQARELAGFLLSHADEAEQNLEEEVANAEEQERTRMAFEAWRSDH